jgi:hypothetical protein
METPLVGGRQHRSGSMGSALTGFSSRSGEGDRSPVPGNATQSIIGIVKRLIQKLLLSQAVVITLRVSQGTSRALIDLSIFWKLVHTLEAMALVRSPGSHELFVVVVCQHGHLNTIAETAVYPKAEPIFIRSLNYAELTTYVHLCLGLKEVATNSSEEPSVPVGFARWLSRFADVPRYIEEGLTQLHRAEMIEIIDGKCITKVPLESIRVADWVHTAMVAHVVSEAEALSREKQQVLQVATTLRGPFSTTDLAAANRIFSHRALPQEIIMQQCVKQINACLELTKSGLLRKCDGDWDQQASEHLTQADLAHAKIFSHDAPAWYIPSALIYQVIAATLFQSHRMELKRAILVSRAVALQQRQVEGIFARTSSTTSAASDAAHKRSRSKGKRTRHLIAAIEHWNEQAHDGDIPISCLVTPLLDESDDDSRSDCFMAESEEPIFSSRMSGGKVSITSALIHLDDQPEEPPPRTVDLVEFLPLKCLARFAQLRLFYSLCIAAFGREITLMIQGSQRALDVFLFIAALFILWDLLFLVFKSRSYFRNLYIVSDITITAVIFSDISWALGMADDSFLVLRRQSGMMIYVVCFFLSLLHVYAACQLRFR